MGHDKSKHHESSESQARSSTATIEPPRLASHLSGRLDGSSVQASLSAVGTAHAEQFEAIGSAVGFVSAGGDATITASATPMVRAKGDIHVRQAYASAMIAGGDVEVSQAGAPIIMGKLLSVEQGGSMVMLSGEAHVSRGFIGVLLSPKVSISDDSRVLLSTRGALIIAAALFGGFALFAAMAGSRFSRTPAWRRNIQMPEMRDVRSAARRLRNRIAA